MTWKPHIEGTVPIQASNDRFIAAVCERVEKGLLTGERGPRANYKVIESNATTIRVTAVDWWTAINVGLNDLILDASETGLLRFRLQYWRWAIYCIVLCSVLGLAGAAMFLAIDIRNYIANNPRAKIPGLTIEQNVYLAWGNVLFWGFVWPWILIALHKRPLRRLLARVVGEIDASARTEMPSAGQIA